MITRRGREVSHNKEWQRMRIVSAAVFILTGLILSACLVSGRAAETAVPAPMATVTQEEQGPFAAIDGVSCIPNLERYEEATLIDVVDGDSIKVIVDGVPTQVRYIGVNTPEYDSPQREQAIEATNANRALLSGATLYLFRDISNTDKYDRLLRYVIANGKFINLELVRGGYAESKTYRPDISCQALFDAAVPF